MTLLLAGLFLMLLTALPVHAQEGPSGDPDGLYDDDPFATEYSDSATEAATTVAATPDPRLYETMSTADTPVAGTVETTAILLIGGLFLILLGYRLYPQSRPQ
jgi:hypothetical protein